MGRVTRWNAGVVENRVGILTSRRIPSKKRRSIHKLCFLASFPRHVRFNHKPDALQVSTVHRRYHPCTHTKFASAFADGKLLSNQLHLRFFRIFRFIMYKRLLRTTIQNSLRNFRSTLMTFARLGPSLRPVLIKPLRSRMASKHPREGVTKIFIETSRASLPYR